MIFELLLMPPNGHQATIANFDVQHVPWFPQTPVLALSLSDFHAYGTYPAVHKKLFSQLHLLSFLPFLTLHTTPPLPPLSKPSSALTLLTLHPPHLTPLRSCQTKTPPSPLLPLVTPPTLHPAPNPVATKSPAVAQTARYFHHYGPVPSFLGAPRSSPNIAHIAT